ncbi:MAG TPA: hypothetical protein VK806_06050 [Bacteroidia bacterium]|nr:hypothetical protein [Bacteroidia bacterium]
MIKNLLETLKKKLHIAFLSAAILFIVSCSHNPLKIDVSGINVPPVKIQRLERDMFTMKPDSVNSYTSGFIKKYGRFYVDFVTAFINDGGIRDSTYAAMLRRFITDKDMHGTFDSCEKVYPDMGNLESGLTDAFKHFKYYFPDKPLPRVVTDMSGYQYSIIYYDSTLALSLEMYLGKNCSLYKMLNPPFPRYKTMHMTKNYLLGDAVYGWLASIFKANEDKPDMLGTIIHEGKIMYLEDAMLPDMNDTIKLRYTASQLKWCKENEFYMWAYIIKMKLLYSTDHSDIAKFTDDGPFTSVFNRDFCPSRTGSWLGLQIVRSYMKKNSNVTLQQLIEERNADNILQHSGYKPEK